MSATDRTLGIDISKHQLDVHLQPDDRTWQVANTDDGVRQLTEQIAELQPVRIVRQFKPPACLGDRLPQGRQVACFDRPTPWLAVQALGKAQLSLAPAQFERQVQLHRIRGRMVSRIRGRIANQGR